MLRRILQRRYVRIAAIAFAGFLGIVIALVALRGWLLRDRVALQGILVEEPLDFPTHLAEFPDGSGDMAVAEKKGRIKWFRRGAARAEGLLLDLTGRVAIEGYEDGLLSIAFHPRFAENGWFFVAFTAREPRRLQISRFQMMGPGRRSAVGEESTILAVPKPGPNHNGGTIAFAPDGMMFVSVGDSQIARNGQDRKTLLGKILRIDVDHPSERRAYGIPAGNPFVGAGKKARPEIWAYGFRNVWRISIDRETGELWAGDVGSERFEEVNRVVKGGNYGWAVWEGTECIRPGKPCHPERFQAPVVAMPRYLSRAIIGGFVYRGAALPWLQGRFVFGDLFRGLYSVPAEGTEVISIPDVLLYRPRATHGAAQGREMSLASLAVDLSGELYVIDLSGGLYRVVAEK